MPTNSKSTSTLITFSKTTTMQLGIVRIIVANVVLPLALYTLLKSHMSQVAALLVSGIPPLADTVIHMLQDRVDSLSVLTVLSTLLSAVVAGVTDDPRLLLVKDSVFTLCLGLAFWVSTVVGQDDLVWRYNKQLRGPDAAAQLDAAYAYSALVRAQSHWMCLVWGAALLAESLVRVGLVYSLSVDTMVYVSPALMGVAFALVGVWTIWFVRHQSSDHEREMWTMTATNVRTPTTDDFM
ncbi:Aste57867_23624 [Aphanomyces stellatus]|uniref:Aste57867_23624 protein n=1 Tax=Aphanomyces stellatus TaxID=120398 RepID=A0A485LPV2_9STRA|nr:hypothetical protein As57867_023552 [Aphanomyces stellatus]VFU00269.1 Aste57867_23624 [Aphanomyces stellatus]